MERRLEVVRMSQNAPKQQTLELKKATYQLISNEGKNATKCRDDAGNIVRYLERFEKETDERV